MRFLALLAQMFLGIRRTPCCQTCGHKARGPRALARHCDLEHAGDTPQPGCACHLHELGVHNPGITTP